MTSVEQHGVAPPGWYVDPARGAPRVRWWNGLGWTGSTRPTNEPRSSSRGPLGAVYDERTMARLRRITALYQRHALSARELRQAKEKIVALSSRQ